jgi:hypothetical protein
MELEFDEESYPLLDAFLRRHCVDPKRAECAFRTLVRTIVEDLTEQNYLELFEELQRHKERVVAEQARARMPSEN